MTQFRIRRDSYNWILEWWLEGGINQKTGLPSEGFWGNAAYYGKLKDLVPYLVDKSIVLPDNGNEILQAIKDAEANILKQLEQMQL